MLPTGCPERFHTVEEVIKFITMVIFTVTAQHAAVNSGQVRKLTKIENLVDTTLQVDE